MNIFLNASTSADQISPWFTILWMVALFAIFYLFLIRPERKKRKKESKMRDSVQVGDNITTIGGIVGRVIGIKENDKILILETGSEHTRIKIKKWAIGSVDTIHDDSD